MMKLLLTGIWVPTLIDACLLLSTTTEGADSTCTVETESSVLMMAAMLGPMKVQPRLPPTMLPA